MTNITMNKLFEKCIKYAADGYWAKLIEIINQNPNLAHEQDDSGYTLLMYLSDFAGSHDVLRRLVELGADPNHRSFTSSTALGNAIGAGSRFGLTSIPEVATLLELGVNPNDPVDSGMPALHWAIVLHRPEHASYLIEHGAKVHEMTQDSPPESALDIARRTGADWFINLVEGRKAEAARRSAEEPLTGSGEKD